MCWAFRVFRDIACLCGFFSKMRGLQLRVISGVGAGLNDSPMMLLTFQLQASHLLLWMSSCSWEKGVIATPFYGASSHLWSFSSSILSRLAALRHWCLLKCKLVRIKHEENLSLGAWAPFQALKVPYYQWLCPWAVWIETVFTTGKVTKDSRRKRNFWRSNRSYWTLCSVGGDLSDRRHLMLSIILMNCYYILCQF